MNDEISPFEEKRRKLESRFIDDGVANEDELVKWAAATSLRNDNLSEELDEIRDENDKLRDRMAALEANVHRQPSKSRTKKDMATIVAKDRCVAVADSGSGGGALTYNQIRDAAESVSGETIHNTTVYRVMDSLAKEYVCFSSRKNEDGTRQLRITRDQIPDDLIAEVRAYRNERRDE